MTLKYPKADAQANCPTADSSRGEIQFGLNTQSECFISFK